MESSSLPPPVPFSWVAVMSSLRDTSIQSELLASARQPRVGESEAFRVAAPFGAVSAGLLRRRCVLRANMVRCDTVGPLRSWDTIANCKLQGGFSGEECLEGVESAHRGLGKK